MKTYTWILTMFMLKWMQKLLEIEIVKNTIQMKKTHKVTLVTKILQMILITLPLQKEIFNKTR